MMSRTPEDVGLASKREDMQRNGRATLAAIEAPWAIGPPTPRGEYVLRVLAVLVATLLHGTALYALVQTAAPAAGAGGTVLEAISVEVALIPASALQTSTASQSPASGTPDGAEQEEGAPNRAGAESSKEVEDKIKETEDKKEQEKKEPASTAASDDVAPIIEPNVEPNTRPQSEQEKARRPPANAAGGAVAGSESLQRQPAPVPAVASPGVLRDYAGRVQTALDRTKPKGTGLRGTVRLSFAVGPDGKIEFVRMLKSSGNPALDQAAIAAIHRATVPKPPASLSAAQRVFELPYRFR